MSTNAHLSSEREILKAMEDEIWQELAKYTCIPRLKDIILHSESDATVVKAIELVLNRAYGKPKDSIDVTSGGDKLSAMPILAYVMPKDALPSDNSNQEGNKP